MRVRARCRSPVRVPAASDAQHSAVSTHQTTNRTYCNASFGALAPASTRAITCVVITDSGRWLARPRSARQLARHAQSSASEHTRCPHALPLVVELVYWFVDVFSHFIVRCSSTLIGCIIPWLGLHRAPRTRSVAHDTGWSTSYLFESGQRGGARAWARELVVGRSGSVDSKLSRASQGKILSALLVHWQFLHRPVLAFFGPTAGRLRSLMKSIALAWSRLVPIACPSPPR